MIKHHISHPKTSVTTVKNRKWFGHVTRSCGLAKTIRQGTVEAEEKAERH